ncbi:MAG: hypothetical protein JHC71_14435 [Blastococcus sp.]|nr:hypothetical protein [Blastococcus sp.]
MIDPAQTALAHRVVEPLHSFVYYAPETGQHLTALGLEPDRMSYVAGRAAALGAVGAGPVTATFYNFAPALVARLVPRAWSLAVPEKVLAARSDAARAALARLLGEAASSADVVEIAGLLREACAALTPEGRPLYAAHADLPWPEEPLLDLWHGATLVREHRGDGHVAALLQAGLTGLEALITHTATGRGSTADAARATRGWTRDEWAAGETALAGRGLLDGSGLTTEGRDLRRQVEAHTDALSTDPWLHLGAERVARVVELGGGLARRLLESGAFASAGLARG